MNEFKEVQNKVEALIGYTPHLIRAPYGSSPQIGEAFRADIAAAGFKMWDWTTDSLDWNLPGQPDKIISRIHRLTDVENLRSLRSIIRFFILPEGTRT